jgi:hypothetical protein
MYKYFIDTTKICSSRLEHVLHLKIYISRFSGDRDHYRDRDRDGDGDHDFQIAIRSPENREGKSQANCDFQKSSPKYHSHLIVCTSWNHQQTQTTIHFENNTPR